MPDYASTRHRQLRLLRLDGATAWLMGKKRCRSARSVVKRSRFGRAMEADQVEMRGGTANTVNKCRLSRVRGIDAR
jgi:hypothetical protein